jgi:hypothetical protein
MPFVRNWSPDAGPGLPRPSDTGKLLFFGVSLSVLFALAAFLFFVLRDQSQVNVMVNYQQRSALAAENKARSSINPAPLAVASTAAPTTATGRTEQQARGTASFTLQRSGRMGAVGPLQVRLIKTDVSKGTYDVTGSVAGRTFTHRNVRVNEAVWVGVSKRVAPVKFVADSIGPDQISGYWTQSSRTPAALTTRSHTRRR